MTAAERTAAAVAVARSAIVAAGLDPDVDDVEAQIGDAADAYGADPDAVADAILGPVGK